VTAWAGQSQVLLSSMVGSVPASRSRAGPLKQVSGPCSHRSPQPSGFLPRYAPAMPASAWA